MQKIILNSHNSLNSQVMYGLAGRVVKLFDPCTESDPYAVLMQFISVFGNIVGNKPHFKVESTQHTLKVYPIIVGKTSRGRKGTALDNVMSIIKEIDSHWVEENVISGLASGEGLIKALENSKGNEKGMMVIETEFASVLKIMSKEGNILSPIIRKAWDSTGFQNLTKQNPLRARNTHLSVIGHITAEELKRYLNKTEMANGFGNRCLWFLVERSKLIPNPKKIDDKKKAIIISELKECVNFSRRIDEIDFPKEIEKYWEDIYFEMAKWDGELVGALLGRAEPYVKKLACVYALLDKTSTVGLVHMKVAFELMKYSKTCVEKIFAGMSGNEDLDKLVKEFRTKEELTKTDIHNLFRRHKNKEQVDCLIKTLERSSVIQRQDVEENTGRPTEVWRYVGAKKEN